MNLEVGKCYRDEEGRKVGPLEHEIGGGNNYFYVPHAAGSWHPDGSSFYPTFGRTSLVAEWLDLRLVGDAPQPAAKRLIDTDSATRKKYPMAAGLLDYFPDALAEVAKVSHIGNEKHNPGEPMHHARGKSMDHADCIVRHLVGRGGFDGELRESAALAWRALALLQEELEREMRLSLPRGARAAE